MPNYNVLSQSCRLFGARLGRVVLKAQTQPFASQYKAILENTVHHINDKEVLLSAERVALKTIDDEILDSLHIKYKGNTDSTQTIVYFVGSGMCYEQILSDMILEAKDLNCNAVAFNFRGVSQSTGQACSKNDLVLDGITQIQHLLDIGVDPETIIIKGHSLGAAIATLVTKHFYDIGININLFNGRSFSSLSKHFVGQIRSSGTSSGHMEPFKNKVVGALKKPIIKLGLRLTLWEINAAEAYRAIPDSHKDYCVVRSGKSRRLEFGSQLADDPVVTHYASLHKSLKVESANICGEHRSHKVEAIDVRTNGHNVRLKELKTQQGESANDLFRHFCLRVKENHKKSLQMMTF